MVGSALMATVERLTEIQGIVVVRLAAFGDARGQFFETYRRSWIPEAREMIQGNRSDSKAGVLRGLHYHRKQADFWYVPSGRVRAALFDFREASPTYRATTLLEMGDGQDIGLYIPRGVAHGFCAITDCVMTYLVDEYYDGADELGILWNDPALGIDWGVASPILSARDRANPLAAAVPQAMRPGAA